MRNRKSSNVCSDEFQDRPEEDSHENAQRSGQCARLTFLLCLVLPVTALLYIEYFIPSPVNPEAFELPPIPKFEGALSPNDRLTQVKKLFKGKFRGPESMAIYKGKIYTGVADGRILELDISSGEARTLVKTLGKPPCGKIVHERNCGRPLGLRARDGVLYVVDAYLGLFKVDIETGRFENLFPASMKFPDGQEARFLNDVEVAADGRIYVTDSSSRWHRSHHCYVGFENRPDGRLIEFDPDTNRTQILLRNLYFANGLQLTPQEDALLITEMARSRVTRYAGTLVLPALHELTDESWIGRYNLNGPNAGKDEIFADNLPGLPDNIRPSTSGGYWVALAVVRHPDYFSVWDSLSNYPWVRKTLAKFFHRDTIGRWVPPYSLVVELDSQGQLISSLHDPTGKTFPAISEVQEHDGAIYIGSYFLPFLGKLEYKP